MNKLPRQLHLNVQLDNSISLDKFIECESTKDFLKILIKSTTEQSVSNFYLIWGAQGRGKSYVMQGLHKKYIQDGKKTLHFSFEDKRINSTEILMNLSSLEAIFIEDFESMEDSEDWERGMFNLINECYMNGTKIYLSSNKVTKNMQIRLADLASRLSSFTAIEIPEITEEEKNTSLNSIFY